MEAAGAAASILAIAGAGIEISLKLIAFADQVGTAAKRIQDVGTDVSVTAGTLQELGELMNKRNSFKKSGGMFHPDQIQNIKASSDRCKGMFDDLKAVLGKASQQLRDVCKAKAKGQEGPMKIRLSRLERMKWPFLQPSIGPLQSGLRDAKSTLILILQVVQLRHAQITASIDPDEQRDLVRMIAAMRRQQKASLPGDEGGYKVQDIVVIEDSDSEDISSSRTILEAWSVTPNVFLNNAFEHILVTPIPISQQEIAKSLRTSPQDFCEIASMIDSLSIPERDAILEEVLCMRYSEDTIIRSISSQLWTGSHDLFGKVNARKFKVIVERRVRVSRSSGADLRSRRSPRRHIYTYTSSPSPASRERGRREREQSGGGCRERLAPGSRISSFERERRRSDHLERRSRESEQRLEEETSQKLRMEKEDMERQHNRDSSDSQPGTEAQPTGELSDDDLVKSLLAQYTNFEPGEPLVQSTATPLSSYDESFELPKRDPRPE